MIHVDKVNQLVKLLLSWATSQMISSPSTNKEEIIVALREAADRLEDR